MKTKLVLLIVLCSLLQACIPLAFVAGATAGGAIIYDNRSIKTIAEDKDVEIRAQSAIDIDPQLRGNQSHIIVIVFNHIMLLVGQAPTPELQQRAYDIVSKFPHIKRIYNEITVGATTSNERRTKDVWITTKAKTLMLAEKGLHSTHIKVVTEDGIIYLMGLVTHTQGNLAAQVASQITGVKQVVKLFEYQH